MPSPFPGMNPYLEQPDIWQDFHDRYIPALGDALAAQVSPHFIVKIEEHVYLHNAAESEKIYLGNTDMSVATTRASRENGGAALGVVTAPVRITVPALEVEKLPYLEIIDRQNRELVTVVEVLSPSNKKPGAFHEQCIYKRALLLHSFANYVEIDLLRGGTRMPLIPPPTCDYYAMVSCYEQYPQAGFWPIGLREPLPTIPIPLRPPLDQVLLDLQALLHLVYDRAYYKDHIYEGAPVPPLRKDDAAWAGVLLHAADTQPS